MTGRRKTRSSRKTAPVASRGASTPQKHETTSSKEIVSEERLRAGVALDTPSDTVIELQSSSRVNEGDNTHDQSAIQTDEPETRSKEAALAKSSHRKPMLRYSFKASTITTKSPSTPWVDTTERFNLNDILPSLISLEKSLPSLPTQYHWFSDALPVSALFPPGIPLTVKEINAYYPHHIRYPDVMLRFVNNGYRHGDIHSIQSFFRSIAVPLTKMQLGQLMRDCLLKKAPKFKVTEGAWEGKPDPCLSTAPFVPTQNILGKMGGGFTVPTFDQLLKGLKFLPEGDDARELTTCLVWYLEHRDRFTPRLEFNVLHVQLLLRALQIPLPPYGDRNLNREGFDEWRNKGAYQERKVEDIPSTEWDDAVEVTPEKYDGRSVVEIDIKKETVKLHISMQTRHILTYPYMCLNELVQSLKGESDVPSDTTKTPPTPKEPPLPVPNAQNPSPKKDPSATLESFQDKFRGYRIPKRIRSSTSESSPAIPSHKKVRFKSPSDIDSPAPPKKR
ncbi:unnamed protein product [Periconia digitata]|uniref:Uncharacterized protein n=1 Tax=Periconia digitata TaxID=1303443 RepID=A0A9W4U2W9_9PLEO|nr:unnamed protein product [Periconia digitata]